MHYDTSNYELCQNHKGDVKILDEMVAAGTEAGANCKIQSMHSKLTHRIRFDEGEKLPDGTVKTIKDPTKMNMKDYKIRSYR